MRRITISLLVAFFASSVVPAVSNQAWAKGRKMEKAIQKPIKTLISAVRYSKDALAQKMIDGEAQASQMLGEEWTKATDEQRTEFTALFHTIFSSLAFPRIRKDFEHLETILYDKAQITGDTATIGSTIVVLHTMKKQEIKVDYALKQQKGTWRVVDVKIAGDKSMLSNIQDDQIRPIMKESGWGGLLDLMRKRAEEIRATKPEK